MTILRFGPLLALAGAACLVAWTPHGRSPPPEVAALDRASGSRSDVPPTETASLTRAAQSASAARTAIGDGLASLSGAEPAVVPAPSAPAADLSDKDVEVGLASANLEGASPSLARSSATAPPVTAATPEPICAGAGPRAICALRLTWPLPSPPLSSQAVILYKKGDVAGLTALAASATDPAERSALEWASLRADPHPAFALARRLPRGSSGLAEPRLDSRAAGSRPRRASAGAGDDRRIFRRRPAAIERGQDRRGARGAGVGPRLRRRRKSSARLWRDGSFDALTESVILREFGASLTKADHAYRADRLLYANYLSAGARAAALAGPDVLALAQARIGAARAPMSPGLVKAVPTALRNDPGLLFSRIQYARRAGRVYEAAVLLSLAPHDRAALVNRDRWWSERKMVARALLDLDEPRLAFEVCDQTVRPDTSEAQVDAAFHAGWIALRFLDDAPSAAKRFALAAEAAENPLSVARAGYWQGRAAEAMGDSEAAKRFYLRAASVPIAYYGQLAAQRLGETRLAFPTPAAAAEGDRRDEAVRAVQALYADGLDDLAAALAFDAARQWRDESQLAAMAEVVKQRDDVGTQVRFAKIAVMQGHPLEAMAFPAVGMPAFVPLPRSADLPTVYAVARQESEFIWHASSGAGAKGLMQMLPSTAVVTARRAGVEFDPARLIVDPAFNTQLGAALLGQLIEDQRGSRELAFAAYNAGPGRVAQWIAAHGDPRDGAVDLVDWIERIPFDETRDYVERVSENLGVYRQRFADEKLAPPAVSARVARE